MPALRHVQPDLLAAVVAEVQLRNGAVVVGLVTAGHVEGDLPRGNRHRGSFHDVRRIRCRPVRVRAGSGHRRAAGRAHIRVAGAGPVLILGSCLAAGGADVPVIPLVVVEVVVVLRPRKGHARGPALGTDAQLVALLPVVVREQDVVAQRALFLVVIPVIHIVAEVAVLPLRQVAAGAGLDMLEVVIIGVHKRVYMPLRHRGGKHRHQHNQRAKNRQDFLHGVSSLYSVQRNA